MWGLEVLWPELILVFVGLVQRWRLLSLLGLAGYALAVFTMQELLTPLIYNARRAVEMIGLFGCLSLLAWGVAPPSRPAGWAILLQLGSYGLLLRSSHLAFSWAALETGALAGYFLVAAQSVQPDRWQAALRYLIWNMIGSALILLGIAVRYAYGLGSEVPLQHSETFSELLLGWGWAIKSGFIPWHFWLIGVYRALPVVWAGWFATVPKGALLLAFLNLFPSAGQGLAVGTFYFLAVISLLSGYALAWPRESPLEKLFWASLAQAPYLALAAYPRGTEAGWAFWAVYGIATFLSFLYVEQPWRGLNGHAIGLLLLANLAGLPPVLGFWVKLQLFWAGLQHTASAYRGLLIGAAALATVGGIAVYGRILWELWQAPPTPAPPLWRKLLYLSGSFGLFGFGVLGL
ncbi:MAG: proton-conducting transporter membrane subunit [Bacteroidia bacterium]